MSEQKRRDTVARAAAVEGILKALTSDGELHAEPSLEALAYVTALIMDIDPSVTAKSHMRRTVEEQAARTLTWLRAFREHFEASGDHLLEQIGGTAEISPGIVAGMTRQ